MAHTTVGAGKSETVKQASRLGIQVRVEIVVLYDVYRASQAGYKLRQDFCVESRCRMLPL